MRVCEKVSARERESACGCVCALPDIQIETDLEIKNSVFPQNRPEAGEAKLKQKFLGETKI